MGDTEEYLTDRMVKRVKKEILKCNINCVEMCVILLICLKVNEIYFSKCNFVIFS